MLFVIMYIQYVKKLQKHIIFRPTKKNENFEKIVQILNPQTIGLYKNIDKFILTLF
jgi:hypothetical protein